MALVHRVKPGQKVRLRKIDPASTGEVKRPAAAATFEQILDVRLPNQQELLYAAACHSVLIVLQGIDTAGKDGTIKHVMTRLNPAGCRVDSFKVPTPEEKAHDFLWRAHRVTPELGWFGIFNRSHYEDVLVTRVDKLVPKDVLEVSLRAHKRIRAPACPEQHDRPKVLPLRVEGRAARALARA